LFVVVGHAGFGSPRTIDAFQFGIVFEFDLAEIEAQVSTAVADQYSKENAYE
jgi:hypothetical protein